MQKYHFKVDPQRRRSVNRNTGCFKAVSASQSSSFRRSVSLLLNLRHLIDQKYQLDCDSLTQAIDLDYVEHCREWLEPVFREHLSGVFFFPQHRLVAEWLSERWEPGLAVPNQRTPF